MAICSLLIPYKSNLFCLKWDIKSVQTDATECNLCLYRKENIVNTLCDLSSG